MFDLLGPVGAIKAREMEMEAGQAGPKANCAYLRLQGLEDSVPTLVYTPEEWGQLLEMVSQALALSPDKSLKAVMRLGRMPEKPLGLRVSLVPAREPQPALVHFRFYLGDWFKDVMAPPNQVLSLLKMASPESADTVTGVVEKQADESWKVDGKRFVALPETSPGRGVFGEYLHSTEVASGTKVEIWPMEEGGVWKVLSFRVTDPWRPSQESQCPDGEVVDKLLSQGLVSKAEAALDVFTKSHLASGKVDATWASKSLLSHLLGRLLVGDDQAAHKAWLGKSENPILEIGSKAIEMGQTSVHDTVVYQLLSSHFHSLNPDAGQAEQAVNQTMLRVYRACKEQVPHLTRIALSNWYLYLCEVYEGQPPEKALAGWQTCLQDFGQPVEAKQLRWPLPYPWLIDWEQAESVPNREPEVSSPRAPLAPGSPSLATPALPSVQLSGSTLGKLALVVLAVLMTLWAVKGKYTHTEPTAALRAMRATTGPVVEATAQELGRLSGPFSIGGLTLKGDFGAAKAIEKDPNWSRYETPFGDVIAVQDDYERRVAYIQGSALVNDGKVVLSTGAQAPAWDAKKFSGIELQVLDGKVLGFSLGDASKTNDSWNYSGAKHRVWAPHSTVPKGAAKFIHISQAGNVASEYLDGFTRTVRGWEMLRLADGTPLILAVAESADKAHMVQRMLEEGADPNLPDLDGKTAIDVAATDEIRELLR